MGNCFGGLELCVSDKVDGDSVFLHVLCNGLFDPFGEGCGEEEGLMWARR